MDGKAVYHGPLLRATRQVGLEVVLLIFLTEATQWSKQNIPGIKFLGILRDGLFATPGARFQRFFSKGKRKAEACQDSTKNGWQNGANNLSHFSVLGSAHPGQYFGTRHCCCLFEFRNSGIDNPFSML
jgi:hypothetical protein